MKNETASFLLALQFLTRLPVRSDDLYTPARMAASVKYYGLIGVIIGALSATTYWIAAQALPQTISVMLAIAAGLLVTGAFHEDGLADTFDGIGGGLNREKALEIMKDSRIGVYGSSALIMALTLKAAALMALSTTLIVPALIAGHALSRLSSVFVIATSSYVRGQGVGKPVADGVSAPGLMFSALTGTIIIAVWCISQPALAVAYGVGALVVGHISMRLFFEPKISGYTGDTLGAVQQASEIAFYLGLAAWR
ncbi:MAG: adenosylcobinamide-GDP ribazoletransferase [Pseudomonadota bacterium]